jgi:Uma2 family endonuclease
MNERSVNQGRILRNLMRLIDVTCSHSLYEVLPYGVQVWLPEEHLGIYPDLVVVAGKPLFHDGQGDRLLNPCLIFEILPPLALDSGPEAAAQRQQMQLFRHCQSIPYLMEYVFVHQAEVRVEQFLRTEEHWWTMTTHSNLGAVVELSVTDARLPVMEIYDRTDFICLV